MHTLAFSSIIVPRLVCSSSSSSPVSAFYCFNWNMCLPNVYTSRTKKLHANLHFQSENTHTQLSSAHKNRLNVHLRFNLCLRKANKIVYSSASLAHSRARSFILFLFLVHLFGYDRRSNNIFFCFFDCITKNKGE